MEKIELKGDFYNGKYHAIEEKSELIHRHSPADLDYKIWETHISYSNIEKVLNSAQEGFQVWRNTPLESKVSILNKYAQIVKERSESIVKAIAIEIGKPLWEARTEANALAAKVAVTINESLKRIEEKKFPEILPNTTGKINYKPIGPCLIIGPFNFPCHLANGQILSALLAGNSIIFKPSEKAFYSTQLMFDCLSEAGFPSGVINLILGGGETASRLLKDKSIKGVFFTGSAEVGRKILQATYKDFNKLVALELGGKNTTIIDKDCPNENYLLSELIQACFLTTGQRCTSTSLVLVHRSKIESLVQKFHQLAKRLIVDHPIQHDHEPFMGPLVDQKSVDAYLTFMGMAKREGFEEVMRGKVLDKGFKGHYVSPSIHYSDEPRVDSLFFQSEIFGPNCTFIPFDDIEQAVRIANSTDYGLASSIFTHNNDHFNYCSQNIEAGIFNHNRSTVGAHSKLPFGGVKNSGNYRPAAVSTIDACVYSQSILQVGGEYSDEINLKGVKKD